MGIRTLSLTLITVCSILAACDTEPGEGFPHPNPNPNNNPPGGNGGGGNGTAGSLGVATLVYAEAPGNTGFDDVKMNGAGTVAVFLSQSDPLGTNPGGDDQLFSIRFGDADPVQITSGNGAGFRATNQFDINTGGSIVAFVTDQDLTGENPTNTPNLFLAATDGSAVAQVTTFTAGTIANPAMSGDGTTIVFTSSEDLTGGNPMNDTQIFSIASDGTNLAQVTTGVTAADAVALSDDGSKLVWIDTSDPFGTNADGSGEVFAINTDGTNHMQLTASAGDSITPRISDNGSYVVFASAADLGAGANDDARLEVYVVSSDGTGLTRITDTDQDSGLRFNGTAPAVDISGDGNWITFMSYGDLNGINTNNTYTVYWANRQGTTIQQLLRLETKPDGVTNRAAEVPRMSDDGSQILFNALAPYSENAPDSGWKIFLHSRI